MARSRGSTAQAATMTMLALLAVARRASSFALMGGSARQMQIRGAVARARPAALCMSSTPVQDGQLQAIKDQIAAVGDRIRSLKAESADKSMLQPEVEALLSLKAQYQTLTGEPFDPPKAGAKKPQAKQQQQKGGKQGQVKGQESDKITPRNQDYSQWYLDVISAAELVDSSPVKGCMVIRPWGMAVWDALRNDLDARIKDKGVSNAYFPLFIPRSFLSKEAEHVEGFAKECAVVTHHRLCADPNGGGLVPDPEAKLEEPLVVRPTSETIIWHMFGKWISSHRDLPMKINQWANVVRWEMRTRPFLRSAEFLWQEGHTAHATREDALKCAREMLDMYADSVKDMLALPVVKGTKSPMERFAGAEETFTIEGMMQNGWALQSGTSHFLGQNFARAFDVYFQTKNEDRELVWATSWGVSTRLMGALVMTHSDDAGLRQQLPPAVAPHQVVIVPITKGQGEDTDLVNSFVDTAVAQLKAQGIRVKVDDRDHLRPGAKYFEWERKGVPLRLEVGARDAKGKVLTLARRTGGDKTPIPLDDSFAEAIQQELQGVHELLWKEGEDHMASGDKDRTGFYLVPWCCDASREKEIQEDSKATIRCYPLDLNEAKAYEGKTCFYSGEPATHMALFARAF
ncbi:hypothetical protein JKP88DRAFT_314700 [Tribonema minus]|uniref:proline--tRNA ligase n=1 Tax=Tribonema minus TaxID=303371 RepID=A0A835Z2K2_9STRA|nr:hypothetical protein JKP88DRAFT_314700 [Tribonema minus]